MSTLLRRVDVGDSFSFCENYVTKIKLVVITLSPNWNTWSRPSGRLADSASYILVLDHYRQSQYIEVGDSASVRESVRMPYPQRQNLANDSVMSADDISCPTLRDLASEIGQVQIYWSFLENEMRNQLNSAVNQERIARGPIISHWRAYVQSLAAHSNRKVIGDHLEAVEKIARIRNLLAHGIKSVSANPWARESALVVCAGPDGVTHELTIEMVRGLSEEIDRVRRSIRELGF